MTDCSGPADLSPQDGTVAARPAKPNCFCYIVECADGSYYTGWTTDPRRRELQHNRGRGARYTRTRRPVRLVYIEPQQDRSTAMRRERRLKNLTHAQKKALISTSF